MMFLTPQLFYYYLQGGNWCCFKFNQTLPCNVQSGIAVFEGLGNVDVIKGGDDSLFGKVPSAQKAGWVTVTLMSIFATQLGETKILYVDEEKEFVQRVLNEPRLLSNLFRELERKLKTANEGETQDSGNLDFTNPVHVLCLFIYAAAESGAQQFIEMIFNSSAGRIVFDAYKDRPLLPEVIAKSHGNKETAHYLQDITKRFSEEITTGKECPQTIDWSELVNAAEAAEKQLDVTSEKDVQIQKDIHKETGYLGDIDTSSSASSEAQSSDSDDDISRTSRKGIQMGAEECKQPIWQHEDHAIEAIKASLTQSPKLFLKDGVITDLKIKTLKWKENGLHLIQASHFQDACNVREVKYLQGSGISFLLGLGNEPVQHHLTTAYQRLGYSLALSTERNACYKVHVDTAEDYQSLERLSITVGNVADCKASRLDVLQQLCCRLISGEFTATANREEFTVRGKSAECLMEHCQSTARDFWVLTYIFRPTRKILFVYVADSKDVFPFASCFDGRQYELLWHRQQWRRCKNNVAKVQERCKLPESKSSKKGEIWLQGDLHRRDSNRDSEDSIAGNYQGRKEILQFESKSSKNSEIWQQGDLYRKDRNRDSEDSIAGNYRGRKETLHQFEFNSGKKGEIWQQGALHRKDRSRDTGNSIADNYLDRRKTLPPLVAGIVFGFVLVIAGFGLMTWWFLSLSPKQITEVTLMVLILLMMIELLCRLKINKMERTTEDFESKSRSGKAGKSWQRTLLKFESKSSKKSEIWLQGDLHCRDSNRDTGDLIAGYLLFRSYLSCVGMVFMCIMFGGLLILMNM